jgi:hypothetical protein
MPDYRITLHKHIYSASLYTNCVNATAPKLKYVVQYFMLFPMIYSKLGHKLTNVKTARINKVLIAFVHRITLRKHRYSVNRWEICRRWPKNRGQKQSWLHLHSKQSRKLARSCFSWQFFAFNSTIYKLTVILLKVDYEFFVLGWFVL